MPRIMLIYVAVALIKLTPRVIRKDPRKIAIQGICDFDSTNCSEIVVIRYQFGKVYLLVADLFAKSMTLLRGIYNQVRVKTNDTKGKKRERTCMSVSTKRDEIM